MIQRYLLTALIAFASKRLLKGSAKKRQVAPKRRSRYRRS